MEDHLFIAATPSSPEVSFDFSHHQLSLKGESYPENAAAFYGKVLAALRDYLEGRADGHVDVDIALTYFNSSSTKMLFTMFDALNAAAERGVVVTMHWYCDEEDDTILEFGEDLHADFPAIRFVSHATSAG
jgi:hypothetical protein